MKEEVVFTQYTHLINKDRLYRFHVDILMIVIYGLVMVISFPLIFISKHGLISIYRIELSSLYLFSFIGSGLLLIERYYDNIIDRSLIVEKLYISNNQELKLKLKWGRAIKLNEFEIIQHKKELNYRSTFFSLPNKRYDYEYIGVKSEDSIYLIPYAEGYKKELISILMNINDKS